MGFTQGREYILVGVAIPFEVAEQIEAAADQLLATDADFAGMVKRTGAQFGWEAAHLYAGMLLSATVEAGVQI